MPPTSACSLGSLLDRLGRILLRLPRFSKLSRRNLKCCCTCAQPNLAVCLRNQFHLQHRRIAMGDVGKRDKGGREDRKKSKLTQKEKRKLKKEKQKNKTVLPST